jgi:exonuclease SbcC
MTAAARKAFMWETLGLDSTFGPLHQAAKDQVNTDLSDVAVLDGQISVHQPIADTRNERRARLSASEQRVERCTARLEELEHELAAANTANTDRRERLAALSAAETEASRLTTARHARRDTHQAVAAGLASRVAELVERVAVLEERVGQADAALESVDGINARIDEQRAEADRHKQAADAAAKRRGDAEQSVRVLTGDDARLRAAIDVLETRLAALTNDAGDCCFTCGHELGVDGHARLVEVLRSELADEQAAVERCRDDAREAAATVDERTDALRETTDALDDATATLHRLEASRSQIDGQREHTDTLRSDLASARSGLSDLTGQLGEAQEHCTALDVADAAEIEAHRAVDALREGTAAPVDIGPLETAVAAARAESVDARVEYSADSRAFDETVTAETEVARLARQRDLLTDSIETHRTLERAFGKDGAPAFIMEGVCQQASSEANRILERLSAGGLTVALSTKAATRAGGWADKLTVTVFGPDGERPIESFSGGERLRIDIALRAALTVTMLSARGARFSTFIADEGWGALDGDGVNAAVDALTHLTDMFDMVLTVTHVPAIAEAMPQQIEVTRDGDHVDVTVT